MAPMQPAAAKDSEASGETATAYDHVRYPGHPFIETHPDQLATLGSLFGMKPARLDWQTTSPTRQLSWPKPGTLHDPCPARSSGTTPARPANPI